MNNNRKDWSASELELVRNYALTLGDVVRQTGRSLKSVKSKRERLRATEKIAKITGEKALAARTVPNQEKDKAATDNLYWQSEYQRLNREYQKSLKQNVLIDRLIADIQRVAPISYSKAPTILKTPRAFSGKTPETAMLIFSDTHIGKVTKLSQTLGFAEYDFPTFAARLKFLEERVISILTSHTTAPLRELVVAMLGDMLDGMLMHGSEAAHINPVFNQFYAGGHAIAQFLRNIAVHVPKVRIHTCCGNHCRWSSQKRMPTENRYSNFDMFLYVFVQSLTRDIPNIEWVLDEQPFAVFKVEGWTFFASHGDNLKGGDKAFGIPMHSMARQMNATTQLFHKHGAEVPNYYILGHFHRPIQLPTGMGDFTVNGAFPGLDNYALDGNFNPVDPMQCFFRVHPKYGKIAEYKLQLKFADTTKPSYDLPGNFSCR